MIVLEVEVVHPMKTDALGGGGSCGWASALYLSSYRHVVAPFLPFPERLKLSGKLTGQTVSSFVGNCTDYDFVASGRLV
jgi:UDP-sulfoquinovose synthase